MEVKKVQQTKKYLPEYDLNQETNKRSVYLSNLLLFGGKITVQIIFKIPDLFGCDSPDNFRLMSLKLHI